MRGDDPTRYETNCLAGPREASGRLDGAPRSRDFAMEEGVKSHLPSRNTTTSLPSRPNSHERGGDPFQNPASVRLQAQQAHCGRLESPSGQTMGESEPCPWRGRTMGHPLSSSSFFFFWRWRQEEGRKDQEKDGAVEERTEMMGPMECCKRGKWRGTRLIDRDWRALLDDESFFPLSIHSFFPLVSWSLVFPRVHDGLLAWKPRPNIRNRPPFGLVVGHGGQVV